ncbi:hypothetical protein B0H15DRAFT_1019657 [Mycena belliarum]|uniref:Uncharacterized protein n=1 Tax=Mycena belliarum TaxID=1033014 RepID=A0AAD6UAV2_9AGAR|nr:hypothetical protein B0H15DRAFT_1019657 [Mycena belliae]
MVAPRTNAIMCGIACICDIALVILIIVFLITRPGERGWYTYVMTVIFVMLMCTAAWSCRRSWKLHKAQTHEQAGTFVPLRAGYTP